MRGETTTSINLVIHHAPQKLEQLDTESAIDEPTDISTTNTERKDQELESSAILVPNTSTGTNVGPLSPDVNSSQSFPNFPKSEELANEGSSLPLCGEEPRLSSVRSSPALAACRIGRYLLLDQLSDGGAGGMYRSVDTVTKQEYACKIVGNGISQNLLLAHSQVDGHANINKLHEALVGEKYTYLMFQRGYGDLHSYVRTKRRLRESEAQRLFSQIAQAVSHCHEQGIILRDIKLRKFVFADPGRTQLKLETLEDAIVLERSADDSLQDKHGCPAYVSPEILLTSGRYSGRAADAWSLGVMLYTLILGRYPFHDQDPAQLFCKIKCGHYPLPDTVSSRARCLIRGLLRHDPSERLMVSDILRHPWFKTMSIIESRVSRPLHHPRPSQHASNNPTSPRGQDDHVVPQLSFPPTKRHCIHPNL